MSCSAKKDPNGTWRIQCRWTGQEQKESNRKEDFKQKKKQKNGMHDFCYNSLLIQL